MPLAGLDRIVRVGSVDIRGIHDLMFVLQTAKPGAPTTLVFVRDGKQYSVAAAFGVPRSAR